MKSHTDSKYFQFINNSPWRSFGITLLGHLLGVLLVGILVATDTHNLFNTQFSGFPYDIRGDDTTLRDQAFEAMVGDANNDMFEKMLPTQDERTFLGEPVQVIYESDFNCLTPSNLQSMKLLEDAAVGLDSFNNTLCQLESGVCRLPRSILRFFDGTFASRDSIFIADPTFSRISQIIGHAFDSTSSPDIRSILSYHIGTDYVAVDRRTRFCRTMFFTGLPLAGFRNVATNRNQQLQISGQRQIATFRQFFKDRDRVGDMNLFFDSPAIARDEERREREQTFYLMIGSFLFVLLFLCLHTLSLWVAFFGLVGIAGSLMWTHLLYTVLFDFEYYGLSQVLAAYIAVAIGVLNLTTYFDSLKDSIARDPSDDGSHAMGETLRDSTKSLMFLHIGASTIFFLQCASRIEVVIAFGIYLGTFTLVHYVSALLYVPTVVKVWSIRFRKKDVKQSGSGERSHPMTRFLSGRFLQSGLGNSFVRWPLLSVLFVAALVFAIVAGLLLSIDRAQPKSLRDTVNGGQYAKFEASSFGQSDEDQAVRVHLTWGLEELHRDRCARTFQPDCLGRVEYDTGFDLSSRTAQNEIVDLCTRMKAFTLSDPAVVPLHIRPSINGNELEINCFLTEQALSTTIPSTEATFEALASGNAKYDPAAYSATSFNAPTTDDSYYRHYEAELIDWLSGGLLATPTAEFDRFSKYVGGVADPGVTLDNAGTLTSAGDYGSFLRFAVIEVNLTVSAADLSSDEGLPIMKAWDDFLSTEAAGLAPPLQRPFQTTPVRNTWAWLKCQDELNATMWLGNVLGLVVTCLAIALVLNSWSVALMATLVNTCIVVLLLGLVAMIGDDIGLNETLQFTFVTALSFVYISPLVLAYFNSSGKDSMSRLTNAVDRAALPVLSGLCTMFGASLFLLGSQLEYVFQFGVILLSWSLFSVVYIFLFFFSLMVLFGPVGAEGRLYNRKSRAAPVTPSDAPSNFVTASSRPTIQTGGNRGASLQPQVPTTMPAYTTAKAPQQIRSPFARPPPSFPAKTPIGV